MAIVTRLGAPAQPQSLLYHRRAALLSQADLAAAANVGIDTVWAIETGRVTPHLGTIRRIAEAMGVDPLTVTEFVTAIAAEAWQTRRSRLREVRG